METREITAEVTERIEDTINAIREAAAMLYVLQSTFLDPSGTPVPELCADAVGGIGRSLERISSDLDDILEQIFKGEPEDSSTPV